MAQEQDQGVERLRRMARQRLESLARAGVDFLPKPRPGATLVLSTPAVAAPAPAAPSTPAAPPTETPIPSPAAQSVARPTIVTEEPMPRASKSPKTALPDDRAAALAVIEEQVCQCVRCPVLVKNRTKTVFGVGNPHARVVFFGEAPGADEDRTGEPFVGRAGQLLTKIIEACTWKREDVYIMNVIKCRPPENRKPEDDEVENCAEYRLAQFDIIRPEYIVCLGATAAQALLGKTWSIGKLRGKFHEWNGIKVLATYHPAYLLRNPEAKKDVWEDMKLLLREMGIELPKKG
jgi:uracil-DNA glycosylase family 4